MLLARQGLKVLVVDRATFPSDTVSTHLIHPPGMAALRRWGLHDSVVATGCPPIDTYAFDLGPITLTGSPGTPEAPVSYAPSRTVLDKLLVDAAADAGVEVREAFTVESMVTDGGRVSGIRGHDRGGATVTEHARVVIGADGRHFHRGSRGESGTVQREAGARIQLLQLLERPTDEWPLRGVRPRKSRIRRRRRSEFLPQAVRARLGARWRRRV
jgi:flavin-dependent dehydrogenase